MLCSFEEIINFLKATLILHFDFFISVLKQVWGGENPIKTQQHNILLSIFCVNTSSTSMVETNFLNKVTIVAEHGFPTLGFLVLTSWTSCFVVCGVTRSHKSKVSYNPSSKLHCADTLLTLFSVGLWWWEQLGCRVLCQKVGGVVFAFGGREKSECQKIYYRLSIGRAS